MTVASMQDIRPECGLMSYLTRLYRVALQLSDSPADAQDLVLDTVATVLAAQSWPQPGANVRTWLYGRLIHPFITANGEPGRTGLRDAGRQKLGGRARPSLGGTDSADAAALEQLSQPDVTAALRALPVESRILVYLADVEGLAYKEIAQVTGIPADTMMSRMRRGRARLRQLLAARAAHALEAGNPEDPERLPRPAALPGRRVQG